MALDYKEAKDGFVKKVNSLFKREKGTNKKTDSKLSKTTKAIIAVVAAVLLFITVMGVGIYGFRWEDSFTKATSAVVPYPVAIVNGRVVLYRDYLEQLDIVKNYNKEFKKVDFKSEEGKKILEQARKDTMTALIEDAIIAKEAARLKISISGKDLNDKFNQLVKSNGGESTFANVLKQYYKLTPNEFKEEIFRPRLLRQELADRFSSDESLNADAKAKAEEVLAKVNAGEDFGELAKKYSQDTTASNGGDLGYFGKGKMVKEFDDAAFALKSGEVSGIVKTVYGFHIIKVTDVKDGEVRASHILIKTKDFNTWLADAVANAKKQILIKY